MMQNMDTSRVSLPRATVIAAASYLYAAAPRTMRGERAWGGTADELGWAADGAPSSENWDPDPVLAPRWAVENAERLLRQRGRWLRPPTAEALAVADCLRAALSAGGVL